MSNDILHACDTWGQKFPAGAIVRLQEGRWLDNDCVNFSLSALVDAVVDQSQDLKVHLHIENSCFHTAFVTAETVRAKEWIHLHYSSIQGRISERKPRMNKTPFLKKRLILFPIFHEPNHWFLTLLLSPQCGLLRVPDRQKGGWILIFIDPLYNFLCEWKQRHVVESFRQLLSFEAKQRGWLPLQVIGSIDSLPKQVGHNDCGVFLIRWVVEIVEAYPKHLSHPPISSSASSSSSSSSSSAASVVGGVVAEPDSLLSLIQRRRKPEEERKEKEKAEKGESGKEGEDESEVSKPFQALTMSAIHFHRTKYRDLVTSWRDATPRPSEEKRKQELKELVLEKYIPASPPQTKADSPSPSPFPSLIQRIVNPISSALTRLLFSPASQPRESLSSASGASSSASGLNISQPQASQSASAEAAAEPKEDNPKSAKGVEAGEGVKRVSNEGKALQGEERRQDCSAASTIGGGGGVDV
uniref:Ubiquitin-like protease family profile domain-containing protein n=1 Tax=Chromera velia CCMP2878 TaxID=1169474 RepID=A0A0G4GH21_9ALVE|eukprot:Cvel_4694.t1-p1 / transcript=Cvel_4694.t1 / gene=Cvel_4694 / organism=Chromera_velia_CCMP2878 / gene_product=hypothetical protein / transcript_product=hypothetical protein / location=Cvel_scaffold208:100419-102562(+) / protein_length=469 / sequence_SO=supercontig / SO=protein_coding / is_pseudo=false